MSLETPSGRIDTALGWMVVTAAGLLTGLMWAPWLLSGTSDRNSFEVFRGLQALGFAELTPLRVLWFVLPVLFGAAAVAALSGRSIWAAVTLAVAAATIAATAVVIGRGGTAAWGATSSLPAGFLSLGLSSLIVVRRVVIWLGGRAPGGIADQGGNSVRE